MERTGRRPRGFLALVTGIAGILAAAAAAAGVGAGASAPGVVDPVAPLVEILVPNGDEQYVAGTEVVFHWTTADSNPGVSTGDYVARIVVADTTVLAHDYLDTYVETFWSWLVPEVVTGSAHLEVRATDAYGNENLVSSPLFSILASGTPAPAALPRSARLLPPHPNPCNPAAKIAFELPRAVRAEVVIYDLRGRRVKRLIAAEFAAGRHATTWHGRDDDDRPVAAGVYAVVLRTATGARSVQKVVLVP